MRRKINTVPSYLRFDHSQYAWSQEVNYRTDPEKYKVGKGEQGVLICEPYKSEILPHWKFKTVVAAEQSARKIFQQFKLYLLDEDFAGADMARKYLQMGYTRARRYVNYKGGRKYDKENDYALKQRGTGEPEKARAAEIFFRYWQQAENDPVYLFIKFGWKTLFG